VALAPVTTRPDGTYVFQDAPPLGSHTYTVSWAGDSARGGATAATDVVVQQRETSLLLTVKHGSSPGSVVGSVQLRYTGGADTSGRPISLTRAVGGTMTALPGVTTDQNGVATFSDAPPAGDVTYTAEVAAHGAYPAASSRASISVAAATALSASASPASALAGEAVTVSGALTSSSAAVAGAVIDVARSGCGTTAWSSRATTTPNGAWTVSDPAPPVGTCAYAVSFAGGNGYQPSKTSTSATVSLRPTELTLTAVRGTGSNKKLVFLTAHLGGWRTNRTVTITAQPSGGSEVVLASGPVDANGDLTAQHQPKTTTTYRVRYTGDEWYRAATTERTL
jgi:hypothetical protein